MSDDLGSGIGKEIGAAIARPVVEARLRRLVQEASGYLDEGERLAAPVAVGTRGGRVPLLLGIGMFALTTVAMIFIGDRIGSSAEVVFFGGLGVGLLLMLLALIVSHQHAVALTDRRLLVFRWRGMAMGHIRDVFIAVPRGDVFTDFKRRLDLVGVLNLGFAPATGRTPIRLDFWKVDMQIAEAIHLGLRRSDSPQHSPSDVTHAAERLARGNQISEDATPGQTPAPGPWGKRPTWPWIAGAGVVALVVIGIFAFTDDDKGRSASTTTQTPTPTPAASTLQTPTTEPVEQPTAEQTQPVTLALGGSATISADGTDAGVINVKSLKITTRPYDKLIGSKPEEGYFLIFTVSLKADAYFDVFEDDFDLTTSNGKRIDEGDGNSWDAVDFDDLLDYAELKAGEHKTGLLVFDSPVKHGTLAYAPNLEGGPIVTWKF